MVLFSGADLVGPAMSTTPPLCALMPGGVPPPPPPPPYRPDGSTPTLRQPMGVPPPLMRGIVPPPPPPPPFRCLKPSTPYPPLMGDPSPTMHGGASSPPPPPPPSLRYGERSFPFQPPMGASSLPIRGGVPPPPPPPPVRYGGPPTSTPPPVGTSFPPMHGGAPPPPPPPPPPFRYGGLSPPLWPLRGAPPHPMRGGVPPPTPPFIHGEPQPPTPTPPPMGTPSPRMRGGAPRQPPFRYGGPPPPLWKPMGTPSSSMRRGAPPPPPPPPPPLMHGGRGRQGLGSSSKRRSSVRPIPLPWAFNKTLWEEFQRYGGQTQTAPEIDVSIIEALFSATIQEKPADKSVNRRNPSEHRKAHSVETVLERAKMPLPDMMAAVLAMDESLIDVDQIENLITLCPTKEEMELLMNFTGDKATLAKREQYFLELMKVPRVESKLRVFSFKIQFDTKVRELRKTLNVVKSACEEICTSEKLKEIMKRILYLGNILNRGTVRDAAVGFKLDSLLKLSDTRSANSKMTLMHYLCKVLASKGPNLLDFHNDLESLEPASKIQAKSLALEMAAIIKGVEELKQEHAASESDGPVSQIFSKRLKDFIDIAETGVKDVRSLYSEVGWNVDALAHYFGEDPILCPFEQVTGTVAKFTRLFKKAHEENVEQAELERIEAADEAGMKAAEGVSLTLTTKRRSS